MNTLLLGYLVLLLPALLAATLKLSVNPKDLELCTGKEVAGTYCILRITQARPTQYAYGKLSSKCKQQELEEMSTADIKDYLLDDKRVVPVIIGVPYQQFYLLDRHHLVSALFKADIKIPLSERYVVAKVHENLSTDKEYNVGTVGWFNFWEVMKKKNMSWLYDEYGNGPMADPINANPLPITVDELKNDPLRSLTFVLRERGAFAKSAFFSEFLWANFLRDYFPYPQPYSDLKSDEELAYLKLIFKEAMKVARSDAARDLPGWGKGEVSEFDCKMFKDFNSS